MKPLPQSIEPQPQLNINYAKYLSGHTPQFQVRRRNDVTIYGLIFVNKYLVGCTSNGLVCVWNVDGNHGYRDGDRCEESHDKSRKRNIDQVDDGYSPILCVTVSTETCPKNKDNTLYDVKCIQHNNVDLLIVSGDPGILIYKWSDFERHIQQKIDSAESASETVDIKPISSFHPYPSPYESIEINCTSYDVRTNTLYGAAGDGFGCYQWDVETKQLLGTFGGGHGGGHTDYLHVVKVVGDEVITCGEDGKMGFWNGKERKLIQIFDIQSTIDKKKQLVTGQSSNRGFMNSSIWNNGSNLWISSVETNGSWLAVGGGAEHGHNGVTSRSSSSPATSGFMTMWHLPSRSFTSGCVTRESINTIVYNPALDLYATGANEGRISYWEATSANRVGRAWCSSSATYAMAFSGSGMMVAAGCGGLLDCFVDRVRVSQFHI